LPQDIPGPGEQLPSNQPFYGITIQAGADGIPAGRIWIPAGTPDANNYYTRYFQVIQDKPGGVHKVDFLWDLRYLAGNAYEPICDSDEPKPPLNIEQRLETLEAQMVTVLAVQEDHENRIRAIEQGSTGIKFGDKIALRTNSGLLAGIEGGGPTQVNAPIKFIGKNDPPHSWESMEILKGE
jgi:hypothetical protein